MPSALRVTGGQVFQADGSFAVADILVREGVIAATGANVAEGQDAELVDGRGLWVLPGFVDLHAHLTFIPGIGERPSAARRVEVALKSVTKARRALSFGITTVRDLGGYGHVDLALRRAVEQGTVAGPRLLCAGRLLTMTGGHCYMLGREADGREGLAKAARTELRAGADHLKLMCSGGLATADEGPDRPELTSEEVAAAVEVARAAGRPVAAHAHPASAIRTAVEAGVGSIEHGSFIDADCAQMMKERGVFVVPTFAIYEHLGKYSLSQAIAARSRWVVDAKRQSFEIVVAAGVTWGVGTDAGSFMDVCGYVRELEILHDLGVGRREALLSATRGGAELLGLNDCGVLDPGKRADFFAVASNPLEGFETLRDIKWTVAAGRMHDWAKCSAEIPPWLLPVLGKHGSN
jgi:imidazolonepropionase-like amidohydrolase